MVMMFHRTGPKTCHQLLFAITCYQEVLCCCTLEFLVWSVHFFSIKCIFFIKFPKDNENRLTAAGGSVKGLSIYPLTSGLKCAQKHLDRPLISLSSLIILETVIAEDIHHSTLSKKIKQQVSENHWIDKLNKMSPMNTQG